MAKEEQKKMLIEIMDADAKDGLYKQQTAVDWLANELPQTDWSDPFWKLKLEQAKAMEKEQIMNAIDRGFDEGCKFPEDINLNNAEQYYNETYNK